MKKHGPDVSEATRKFKKDRRMLIETVKGYVKDSNGVILLRELEATISSFIVGIQHTASRENVKLIVDFETALDIAETALNEMFADRTLRLAHRPGGGRLELRRLVYFPPESKKSRKRVA